jgi:hypothetical protein
MFGWLRRYVVPRGEFDQLIQSQKELKAAVDKLTVELALQALQTPPAKPARSYGRPAKIWYERVSNNVIVGDFTRS